MDFCKKTFFQNWKEENVLFSIIIRQRSFYDVGSSYETQFDPKTKGLKFDWHGFATGTSISEVL